MLKNANYTFPILSITSVEKRGEESCLKKRVENFHQKNYTFPIFRSQNRLKSKL